MSAPKKPSLTTAIPPINREPVELDGTPTSPHGPRFSTSSSSTTTTLQRPIPRADTLDSASTLPSSAATMSPDSAAATTAAGASAMAEANLEGARVGAGVDAAALRMNGQVGGSRTGEGELVGGEEEEELVREHRAALLSSRSRDPAVLVDIPQLPAPEELAAVGATSDAADGEVGL